MVRERQAATARRPGAAVAETNGDDPMTGDAEDPEEERDEACEDAIVEDVE